MNDLMGTSNIIFLLLFLSSVSIFFYNLNKIISNIRLGKPINRSDRKIDRWKNMLRVALGQSKMTRRPISGILHIIIYIGFIIINIEIIEIIVDGITGSHRYLSSIISMNLYDLKF